jgi:hypothetical protein
MLNRILLLTCFAILLGCDDRSTGQGGAGDQDALSEYTMIDAVSDELAEPPTGPLVYQPMLTWQKGEPTYQGTGFLARTPSGEVVGVTSAHFIEFSASNRLVKAEWLSMQDFQAEASFDHLIGPVGRSIAYAPRTDFYDASEDYLIFSGQDVPSTLVALELDTRKQLENSEPVWLPNKQSGEVGYDLVAGYVVYADRDCIYAVFSPAFELQSQSGSPVISQRTGKVIGLLCSGGNENGRTQIYLTPARNVAAKLDSTRRRRLADITGR